jgi:hypothetical protein
MSKVHKRLGGIMSTGPKLARALAHEGELGVREIACERNRQQAEEGWHPGHDDEHTAGELVLAAICYAAPTPVRIRRNRRYVDPWPWDPEWDKRPDCFPGEYTQADTIRMLVKAGALIAAEIDRVARLSEEEYKEIYG